MVVAGFDLATTSGCAVLDGTRVLHVEAYRPPGRCDAEVFFGFRKWMRAVLTRYAVEQVAIEQPLRTNFDMPDKRPGAEPGDRINPVQMKTFLRLYGLRAHAVETCHRLGIGCREVNQMTWRKAFTGNGRADKQESLRIAQRLVPDLKSLDAAEAVGVAWWLNGELRKPADLFGSVA